MSGFCFFFATASFAFWAQSDAQSISRSIHATPAGNPFQQWYIINMSWCSNKHQVRVNSYTCTVKSYSINQRFYKPICCLTCCWQPSDILSDFTPFFTAKVSSMRTSYLIINNLRSRASLPFSLINWHPSPREQTVAALKGHINHVTAFYSSTHFYFKWKSLWVSFFAEIGTLEKKLRQYWWCNEPVLIGYKCSYDW